MSTPRPLRGGLLLPGALVALVGCSEMAKGFDEGFKKSFEASFGQSCTKSAIAAGAAEAKARAICECAGRHLATHYEPKALTRMSANVASPESQKMANEAIQACAAAANPR
jgi:hypothetical protein